MKMSNPTKHTITSITAVSGSSTQPNLNQALPTWNQRKLENWRMTPEWPANRNASASATHEMTSETAIAPMAIAAENLRWRRLAKAVSAAAASGSAGINQRDCTREGISSLHRIDLVHVRGFVMTIDRDDEAQADGGFGGSYRNREDHEHNARKFLRIRAVAPKGDKIQVPRVEHQFNPDKDQDCIAAGQRSRQTDRKEKGG